MEAISFSSQCGLVTTWRDPELSHKGPAHMTLIREARHERGFGRRPARCEVPPSEFDSQLYEISVRRCANFAEESAQKLKPAHVGQRCELGERCRDFRRGIQPADGPCDRG